MKAVGVFTLSIGSCKPSAPIGHSTHAAAVQLTVSAAASMQDVLEQFRIAYKAIAPAVDIIYNFGSSGSLAQQIAQGAPVDLFLSASPQWMDMLEKKGLLLSHSRQTLIQNSMVLIVPRGDNNIASFQDLSIANKIAMGEPDSVPAGRYAKETLTFLNLFDDLQAKLVFGKNVRHVLAYVETGNVDAGLVYATDALISKHVQVITTAPANSHADIIYLIAVVKASQQVNAAQALVDFLVSAPALAIFRDYGFIDVER